MIAFIIGFFILSIISLIFFLVEKTPHGWITDEDGDKFHYVYGEKHSVNDDPAMIFSWGTKVWYKEGKWHRESGPARISSGGEKEYWFEDEWYPEITSDLEWLMKVEELKKDKKSS